MKTVYQIRYNHTSSETATSKAEALRKVRREAEFMLRQWGGAKRLYRDDCDGRLYVYTSAKQKAADPDGSRAFAVICIPDQD